LRRAAGKLDWIPIGLLGGPVVWTKTESGDLVLRCRDHGARQLLLYGRYDNEVDENIIVRGLLCEARGMLDIGASYGWYTRLAAGVMAPDATRFAVEANPDVFACLEQSLYDLPGTKVRHAAATKERCTVEFHCAESSNLSSAVRNVGKVIQVDGVPVDELWSIDRPLDFVKCDVEGGELDVLRGARRVRADHQPIWMLEFDERLMIDAGIEPAAVAAEVVELSCCWRSSESWVLSDSLAAVVGTPRPIQNVFLIPASRKEQFNRTLHAVGVVASEE